MLALGAAVAYYEHKDELGSVQQTFLDAGQNPPAGVVFTYLLQDSPSKELTLSISDSNGNVIKAFSSAKSDDSVRLQPEDPLASSQRGGNRFVWDMRYPFARKVPDDKALDPVTTGPLAPPGTYSVTLTVDGSSDTRTFQLIKDPRVETSQEDFEEQFKLAISVRDKFSQVTDAILDIRSIRDQATEWAKRADGTAIADVVGNAANKLNEKLGDIEDELMQTGYKGERDRLHIQAKLNRKLAELMNVISAADFRPTRQIYDVLSDINDRIDPNLVTLKGIKDKDLQDFINLLHEVEIPAIVPSSDFD
jgi:hypothetical protein